MEKSLKEHNHFGIDATIIADSKNSYSRLTTFVLSFPRIVLAEFNTHRMLSRNSASSRAVPFKTMLKRVKEHPFIPLRWMKDHSGMQGNEYFPADYIASLDELWLNARDSAVEQASILNTQAGVTKQICNRLLEPFMWHTIIASGTDWENFFALRAHTAAEIHIQELAYKMLEEYNKSNPKKLKKDEWHIPFGDHISDYRFEEIVGKSATEESKISLYNNTKVKIATARCARVSYFNFEGKDDYGEDLKLHDRLAEMGHWSPFEHCALNVNDKKYHGNFFSFKQYRQFFGNENKFDSRVSHRE